MGHLPRLPSAWPFQGTVTNDAAQLDCGRTPVEEPEQDFPGKGHA